MSRRNPNAIEELRAAGGQMFFVTLRKEATGQTSEAAIVHPGPGPHLHEKVRELALASMTSRGWRGVTVVAIEEFTGTSAEFYARMDLETARLQSAIAARSGRMQ